MKEKEKAADRFKEIRLRLLGRSTTWSIKRRENLELILLSQDIPWLIEYIEPQDARLAELESELDQNKAP